MKMKLNGATGNPDIDRYRRRPGHVEIASDVLALAVALSNLWFVMRLDPQETCCDPFSPIQMCPQRKALGTSESASVFKASVQYRK